MFSAILVTICYKILEVRIRVLLISAWGVCVRRSSMSREYVVLNPFNLGIYFIRGVEYCANLICVAYVLV